MRRQTYRGSFLKQNRRREEKRRGASASVAGWLGEEHSSTFPLRVRRLPIRLRMIQLTFNGILSGNCCYWQPYFKLGGQRTDLEINPNEIVGNLNPADRDKRFGLIY